MKEIVILSIKERKAVDRLMGKYGHMLHELGYPTLGKVSTRKTFSSGTTAVVDFEMTQKGVLWITVTHERSVMMVHPVYNKDFKVGLDMSDRRKMKIVNSPLDRDVVAFLDKEISSDGQTNLNALLSDYIPCEFVKAWLPFAVTKRQFGDDIEIKPVADFEHMADVGLEHLIIKHNKDHLTEGWDIVNLTNKQYYKVVDTISEHNMKFEIENFALPRYCLEIYDGKETNYYFYELEGKKVRCGVVSAHNYVLKWFNVTINGLSDDGNVNVSMHVDDKDKKLEKWLNEEVPTADSNVGHNWEWVASTFITINTFMLHFGDVTMKVETKQSQAPSEEGRKQKKHGRNSVRLFKSYKLVKNWKSQARKKAEITCPCWGVRGHFRHYKNGKVVFVEAYVKGKEKDNYKGKEYNLMPYKEA